MSCSCLARHPRVFVTHPLTLGEMVDVNVAVPMKLSRTVLNNHEEINMMQEKHLIKTVSAQIYIG